MHHRRTRRDFMRELAGGAALSLATGGLRAFGKSQAAAIVATQLADGATVGASRAVAAEGPNAGNTYHLLSNFQIEVNGNLATGWSRWAFVTGGADDTPTIVQGGRYQDTFIREHGAWKFNRREALLDIPVSFPPEAN